MTRYYENPRNTIFGCIAVIFLFGLWPIEDLPASTPVRVLIALTPAFLIAVLFYLDFRFRRKPVVIIDGEIIKIRNIDCGGYHEIRNPRQYRLVLGSDFLAFRDANHRDFIVNEGILTKMDWKDLLTNVRTLPFSSVE